MVAVAEAEMEAVPKDSQEIKLGMEVILMLTRLLQEAVEQEDKRVNKTTSAE